MARDVTAPGTRLYRQVADRVAGIITEEALKPGTRLPPERELAARLNVARSTLREAMIALEIAGQVTIRTGSGIYVTETVARTEDDLGPGPLELLDARELIEGEIAARAAMSVDANRLLAIESSIEAMAKAHGRDTHREADHICIGQHRKHHTRNHNLSRNDGPPGCKPQAQRDRSMSHDCWH